LGLGLGLGVLVAATRFELVTKGLRVPVSIFIILHFISRILYCPITEPFCDEAGLRISDFKLHLREQSEFHASRLV